MQETRLTSRRSVKKAITNRLSYAVGTLEGVKRMVESDADALDILQQTRAISSLLTSVETLVLSSHFKDAAQRALDSRTKRQLNKELRKLGALYEHRQH